MADGVELVTTGSGSRRVSVGVDDAGFADEGPGIPDVPRVLAGGYSTARSLGLGLSGSRRLVDELEIETELGRGTTVRMVKWTKF